MADKSRIRWTNSTLNPMSGCTKLSPGCDNCYAYTLAERLRGTVAYPVGFDLVWKPKKLRDAAKWKEPRFVFVNSMSDWAHEGFADEDAFAVLDTAAEIDWHIYQFLTKRPTRALALITAWLARTGREYLPAHMWMGTTIEMARYSWRANVLRQVPIDPVHGVRFISAEPLLDDLAPRLNLEGIQWLICGGESGPGYRPMPHEWARALRDLCAESGTAFYFKQSAAYRTEMGMELDDRRYEEYPYRPEDLHAQAQAALL